MLGFKGEIVVRMNLVTYVKVEVESYITDL